MATDDKPVDSLVAVDSRWKERVRNETLTARKVWPDRYGYLVTEYRKLHEDLSKRRPGDSEEVLRNVQRKFFSEQSGSSLPLCLKGRPEEPELLPESSILHLPTIDPFKPNRRFPETHTQEIGWPRGQQVSYQMKMYNIQKHARARSDILKTLDWPVQFEGTYR